MDNQRASIMQCHGACERGVHLGDRIRVSVQYVETLASPDGLHLAVLDHIHRGADGVLDVRLRIDDTAQEAMVGHG